MTKADRIASYVTILFGGLLAGGLLSTLMLSPRIDHWRNAYESVSKRSLYFSDGAIDRRLVDLCLRDGEPGVWWKEDCDK